MLEIERLSSYQAQTCIIIELFVFQYSAPEGRSWGYHAGTDRLRLLVNRELVEEARVIFDLVTDLE
jgi:hypothetical protein